MEGFHDIESLRHIVQNVNSHCEFTGQTTKPSIAFKGTVKLHGTNGGVRVRNGIVTPQSRTTALVDGADNHGFAFFTSSRHDDFRRVAKMFAPESNDVTIYGEWCGNDIMKGCGVHILPKHFVVFAVKDHTKDEPEAQDHAAAWVDIHSVSLDEDDVRWLNNQNIYFITQVPTYDVVIDFNDPEPAAQFITDLTLEVERSCPWANSQLFHAYNHGEEAGIGEGIVWVARDYPKRLRFKSKGLKHKKAGTKPKVEVNPEKVAAITELVDMLLPAWRLEQGIDYLRDNGIALMPESTGHYLKWISGDILKEESDRIAANSFEWKELSGAVQRRAREFFLTQIQSFNLGAVAEAVS